MTRTLKRNSQELQAPSTGRPRTTYFLHPELRHAHHATIVEKAKPGDTLEYHVP